MNKSLKNIKTALALYFVHSAVTAALESNEDSAAIAGHICATCCNVMEGTDMIARIQKDDVIPSTVTPWLIKIWETLEHKEADQASEMISITLIGSSIYDRVSDLECYEVL